MNSPVRDLPEPMRKLLRNERVRLASATQRLQADYACTRSQEEAKRALQALANHVMQALVDLYMSTRDKHRANEVLDDLFAADGYYARLIEHTVSDRWKASSSDRDARRTSRQEDQLDLIAAARNKITEKLDRLWRGDDREPIRNLVNYTIQTASRVVSEHLRSRHPARTQLKERLWDCFAPVTDETQRAEFSPDQLARLQDAKRRWHCGPRWSLDRPPETQPAARLAWLMEDAAVFLGPPHAGPQERRDAAWDLLLPAPERETRLPTKAHGAPEVDEVKAQEEKEEDDDRGSSLRKADFNPLLRKLFDWLRRSLLFNDLVSVMADLLEVEEPSFVSLQKSPDSEGGSQEIDMEDARIDLPTQAQLRPFLLKWWAEVCELPPNQRAACLLKFNTAEGAPVLRLLTGAGLVRREEVRQALELAPDRLRSYWEELPPSLRDRGSLAAAGQEDVLDRAFQALWEEMPLDDLTIASLIFSPESLENLPQKKRQEKVINLRRSARERLSNRMRSSFLELGLKEETTSGRGAAPSKVGGPTPSASPHGARYAEPPKDSG